MLMNNIVAVNTDEMLRKKKKMIQPIFLATKMVCSIQFNAEKGR